LIRTELLMLDKAMICATMIPMVTPEIDRVDSNFVSIQPQNHELLAALALYLPGIPQSEQQLAKGLLAAVEKVPTLGLGRFVDLKTSQLTDKAQESLQRLQKEGKLATEGESFIIPAGMVDKINSDTTRMYFTKLPGIQALKEAADAAGKVWTPQ